MRALFCLPLLLLISTAGFALPTYAQTMINDDYKLEQRDVNSLSVKANKPDISNTFNNQERGEQYSGTNYTVHAGFQYIQKDKTLPIPFFFSISNTSLNYGQITPGEPVIRTNTLTVSPGSSPGYQVFTAENTGFQTQNKAEIPDTSCDNGNCSEVIPGSWTSPLTYGLGYRCDNIEQAGCSRDFLDTTYFKSFANITKAQKPQTIMEGPMGSASVSLVTYKINIPGTQNPGSYQNSIIYIAVPTL